LDEARADRDGGPAPAAQLGRGRGHSGAAVTRGLHRRQAQPAPHLGIDETAFARRHQYVSVVTDLDRSRVLYVADDRQRASLDAFWAHLSTAELAAVEAVAMDMWEPYITSTRAHLPDADIKIVFDKFHIANTPTPPSMPCVAWRTARSARKGTTGWWARSSIGCGILGASPSPPGAGRWLRAATKLKTGRAWALKEMLMTVWDYVYPGAAERHFAAWYAWAIRSRLEPIKRVARMLRRHWPNIKPTSRPGSPTPAPRA